MGLLDAFNAVITEIIKFGWDFHRQRTAYGWKN